MCEAKHQEVPLKSETPDATGTFGSPAALSKMKLPSRVALLHEATVKEMKDRVADKRRKAGQLLKRASALRGA